MANSYTFTADKTVTIGSATKKTDIDVVAANTDYIKEALDTIMSSSAADGAITAAGDVTINTDALFVDASAKRVGIGTATPAYDLDVAGIIGVHGTHSSEVGRLTSTDTDSLSIIAIDELALYVANAGVRALHIDISGNIGVKTSSFGASASGVLAIANGTQGAALANAIQIVSEDLSAGNTIPSIRTEGSGIYAAGTPAAATGSIAMKINGTVYHLTASTTAAS